MIAVTICLPCGIKPLLLILVVVFLLLFVQKIMSGMKLFVDSKGAYGRSALVSGKVYTDSLDGILYQYSYHRGRKNTPSSFKVWIACSTGANFVVRKEGRMDGFFKNIGISVELQTGDIEFDRNFYIESDASEFVRSYFVDSPKRQSVQSLFQMGWTELRHNGRTMEVKKVPASFSDSDKAFIENAVRELKTLTSGIPPTFLGATAGTTFRIVDRTLLYVACGVALVTGFATIIWGQAQFRPLDEGLLFRYSLQFTVPAFISFFVFSLLTLKGRSTSHKELMIIFFLSLFAFPLAGYGIANVVNGYLDRQPGIAHQTLAVAKRSVHNRRSTSYYVSVQSWRPGRAIEELRTTRSFYHQVIEGKTWVLVTTKPGKLGFEWLAGYRTES